MVGCGGALLVGLRGVLDQLLIVGQLLVDLLPTKWRLVPVHPVVGPACVLPVQLGLGLVHVPLHLPLDVRLGGQILPHGHRVREEDGEIVHHLRLRERVRPGPVQGVEPVLLLDDGGGEGEGHKVAFIDLVPPVRHPLGAPGFGGVDLLLQLRRHAAVLLVHHELLAGGGLAGRRAQQERRRQQQHSQSFHVFVLLFRFLAPSYTPDSDKL